MTCTTRDLHHRRESKAFTLVELLVVVAILALLLALFLPGIERARRAAWAAVCRSNLRQIGQAMIAYAGDYEGLLPFYGEPAGFGWPRGGGTGARNSSGAQWDVQIAPYLGLDWTWGSTTPPPEQGNKPTVFFCPPGLTWAEGRARAYAETQSYNYNQRVGSNVNNSRRLAHLDDPQHTFLVVDAHRMDSWSLQWGDVCRPATYIGRQHAGLIRVHERSITWRGCYHRHNDRIHVLFAAGHVDPRPIHYGVYHSGYTGHPYMTRFGNDYPLYGAEVD